MGQQSAYERKKEQYKGRWDREEGKEGRVCVRARVHVCVKLCGWTWCVVVWYADRTGPSCVLHSFHPLWRAT